MNEVPQSDPKVKELEAENERLRSEVRCRARESNRAHAGEPADCNWPFCGCHPVADKVIQALQECDALVEVGTARRLEAAEAKVATLTEERDKLEGKAMAYDHISERGEECWEWAKTTDGRWGSNIWHVALDYAKRTQSAEAKSEALAASLRELRDHEAWRHYCDVQGCGCKTSLMLLRVDALLSTGEADQRTEEKD